MFWRKCSLLTFFLCNSYGWDKNIFLKLGWFGSLFCLSLGFESRFFVSISVLMESAMNYKNLFLHMIVIAENWKKWVFLDYSLSRKGLMMMMKEKERVMGK